MTTNNYPGGLTVSIIVLTYNQERTIRRTIDSILAQKTNFSFEIIIGEDCSSDGTRAICEQYVAKHPDIIRLMPSMPNKGLMRNCKDTLASCRGKYVAGCAGDDWWHNTNKLQMQVDYLEATPECVMVYTNYDILQLKSGVIIHNALPLESFDTQNIIDKLLRGFFLPSLTIMYRRERLDYIDFDEYIEKKYRAEDLPMFLEYALHGRIDSVNVSTSTYTSAADSLSHFDNASKMEDFMLNMLEIKLDFIAKHPQSTRIREYELAQIYNKLIFNGAFALFDSEVSTKYYSKIEKPTITEKTKYLISKSKILTYIYKKIKRI